MSPDLVQSYLTMTDRVDEVCPPFDWTALLVFLFVNLVHEIVLVCRRDGKIPDLTFGWPGRRKFTLGMIVVCYYSIYLPTLVWYLGLVGGSVFFVVDAVCIELLRRWFGKSKNLVEGIVVNLLLLPAALGLVSFGIRDMFVDKWR